MKGKHAQKSLKELTLQASPRHLNFIGLLRYNFFLFAYQLASSPFSPTLPPFSRTTPKFPLSTTKATITYSTDKCMKKGRRNMTAFSFCALCSMRAVLQFVHLLPVLRKTFDSIFRQCVCNHLHQNWWCHGQIMSSCQQSSG